MVYIILFLRRYPTSPANPPPRNSSVESPGTAVVEVVKAASANGMERNADAKMQLAKKNFSSITSSRALTRITRAAISLLLKGGGMQVDPIPHLVHYHRLSNKLLRCRVNNRNRTGAPAYAIP